MGILGAALVIGNKLNVAFRRETLARFDSPVWPPLIAPWRSHSRRHVLRLWQVFKPCDVSEPRILVHAVSLGEVNASARTRT